MAKARSETDFGFRKVPLSDKQAMVDDVFHSVARRYDVMNDLMSGGLHRAWKDVLVTAANPPRGKQTFALLDIAGGTGDVALRLADKGGPGTRITVADINRDMLAVGRERAGLAQRNIEFIEANAEALPMPEKSFDVVTIAFGGRFLCLEFSSVDIPALDALYNVYSFNVIPALGRAVTGHAEAYQYLVESIRKFPRPELFANMMRDAGFRRVSFTRLTGGVVALHSGWRL
jgi:demethylmenaquinone methyltransferase / 2-methoxy-6-polyprenyl-1,4-benzoquinol methylase